MLKHYVGLAPVYDYVCTREYYPNGSLALTIGGERDFESIDRAAIERFARRAELPVRPTLRTAEDVVGRMHEAWKSAKDAVHPSLAAAIERQFEVVPLLSLG